MDVDMVEMPIERWAEANEKIAKLEAENEKLRKLFFASYRATSFVVSPYMTDTEVKKQFDVWLNKALEE